MIGLGTIAAITGVIKAVTGFVKGFSVLKYVSPAVAGFVFMKDYAVKYWKVTAIVTLSTLLIGVVFLKNREIDGLKEELQVAQVATQDYARAVVASERSFQECKDINHANARSFLMMRMEAENAVIALQDELIERDRQVEKVDEDIHEFRGKDEDCRSLDDPLPDWFDDWLRE